LDKKQDEERYENQLTVESRLLDSQARFWGILLAVFE